LAGKVRPATEPFTGKDEDAPAGRRRTGEPRPAPKRSPGRPRKLVEESGKDYKEQILGLLQLPAGALAVAGMQNPVYAADSRAVTIYSPNIAEALDQLAHERPEVAVVLDRVLAVGPYGVVLAAVTPLVLQLFVNHGKIPPGTAGTVAPMELIQDLVQVSPNGEKPDDGALGSG
jgi:hypothetical protein